MMSPVAEANFEGTRSNTASKSKPARPVSAMSKIETQKLKEREREYNVKLAAIEQR